MNKNHLVIYLVFVMCFLAVTSPSSSASVEKDDDGNALIFDKLVDEISAAEGRLMNVRFDSEVHADGRGSSADPWKPKGVKVSSTAWYNGLPRSKARVDVHSEILEWEGGSGPFLNRSYSIGFDGETGRIVYHASGTPDKMYERQRAEILPVAPDKLRDEWRDLTTGAAFSLNYLYSEDGITFSDILKDMKKHGIRIDVFREKYLGADCVRIAIDPEFTPRTYWLEPSRGYAFRGYEAARIEDDGKRHVYLRSVVTELVEAGPGLWLPIQAYRHYMPSSSGAENRVSFRASQVKANDPSFDDSIFNVPIPSGYLVQDRTM